MDQASLKVGRDYKVEAKVNRNGNLALTALKGDQELGYVVFAENLEWIEITSDKGVASGNMGADGGAKVRVRLA